LLEVIGASLKKVAERLNHIHVIRNSEGYFAHFNMHLCFWRQHVGLQNLLEVVFKRLRFFKGLAIGNKDDDESSVKWCPLVFLQIML
jgi:hypothetical protein